MWTAAYQAPPSMEFSRQEYWSGVPLPSPLGSLGLSKSVEDVTIKRSPNDPNINYGLLLIMMCHSRFIINK